MAFILRLRFLFWLLIQRTLTQWARWLSRGRRRVDLTGELRLKRGRSVILTPTLLAFGETSPV